jgi:copper chaperone CopZ
VSVAIKKIEGVSSVQVSLNEGVADIVLKPRNKVTVEAVREVVRRNGFTPKDAQVQVAGQVVERGGKPALEVSEADVVYPLLPVAAGPGLPKDATGKKVTVAGRIPEPGKQKDAEPLVLEVGSIKID